MFLNTSFATLKIPVRGGRATVRYFRPFEKARRRYKRRYGGGILVNRDLVERVFHVENIVCISIQQMATVCSTQGIGSWLQERTVC